MSFLTGLLKGGKLIDKVTGVVSEVVTDKDQRNALLAQLGTLMMGSNVAPYIRGAIGLTTVVSCLFFSDKMTIDAETQKYLLYSVFSFYFLDFVQSMIKKK